MQTSSWRSRISSSYSILSSVGIIYLFWMLPPKKTTYRLGLQRSSAASSAAEIRTAVDDDLRDIDLFLWHAIALLVCLRLYGPHAKGLNSLRGRKRIRCWTDVKKKRDGKRGGYYMYNMILPFDCIVILCQVCVSVLVFFFRGHEVRKEFQAYQTSCAQIDATKADVSKSFETKVCCIRMP